MNKRVPPIGKADGTTFEILAERVKDVHNATSSVAKGAVNQLLTIRNWAIGCYIVEYEQEGCDRAKYGLVYCKIWLTNSPSRGLTVSC
ncbi:hypothetical protein [Fibrobacter sp. UWH4]|uniref:hypothetical protein n=1 Tax=Fibrobacter sp. UWH4 TaxID=1896210 RepID=UPI00091798F0|nr:hypothetical protein [Fibrobacter sp. UWH4]SHL08394.1 hypothetical protein SAMN05720762_104147 [Fibrobacter sp. UWH4]